MTIMAITVTAGIIATTGVAIGAAIIGRTATGIRAIAAGATTIVPGAIANRPARKNKTPLRKRRGVFIIVFLSPMGRRNRFGQYRDSAAFSGVEADTAGTGFNVETAAGLAAAVFPKSGLRLPSMKAPDSILMS